MVVCPEQLRQRQLQQPSRRLLSRRDERRCGAREIFGRVDVGAGAAVRLADANLEPVKQGPQLFEFFRLLERRRLE